jgi:acyl-coenzyme A synthetase/AMP-(fatty) acid ligase
MQFLWEDRRHLLGHTEHIYLVDHWWQQNLAGQHRQYDRAEQPIAKPGSVGAVCGYDIKIFNEKEPKLVLTNKDMWLSNCHYLLNFIDLKCPQV